MATSHRMNVNSVTAYISLGGNTGGEAKRFGEALRHIDAWPDMRVTAKSGLYRTEPQGDADQPWFTNQAAALVCGPGVAAGPLLQSMLRLETELGRVRDADRRFGPRVIDLDLLLFGDMIIEEEGVHVPHPRIAQRAFVLVPLLEIAPPSLRLPGGDTLVECLARLRYRLEDRVIFQES